MLQKVRSRLLEEAVRSPALLADLAGLESYIAESYDSRSFIELLQNADDATAARFAVVRHGDILLVANDGCPFSADDFESLCRSASSKKERGTSIGYRGIGFKSVVNIAQKVHLFSGELSATFSRERTKCDVPNATRVPLVRIPHEVDISERRACHEPLSALQRAGYKTVFVFSDLIARSIETEFASFDWTTLLFLRSISQIELSGFEQTTATLTRGIAQRGVSTVTLKINSESSKWTVACENEIAIAFGHDSDGISRLPNDVALVHAFLPTREKSGLGVKLNGDLSTDPSRTRVVIDERTIVSVAKAAQFVLRLVRECLATAQSKPAQQMLIALAPNSDPRVILFQKPSFERSLCEAIISEGKGSLSNYLLRPTWLRSGLDFERLATASAVSFVPADLESSAGLLGLLKALGCREASLEDLASGFVNGAVGANGATDVLERLTGLFNTSQLAASTVDPSWRIWPLENTTVDLVSLLARPAPLNSASLETLQERLGSLAGLRRLVASLSDSATAMTVIPDAIQNKQGAIRASVAGVGGPSFLAPAPLIELLGDGSRDGGVSRNLVPRSAPLKAISLTKWRTAEQQVCEFLTARGWTVRDVGKQNVGYDIEATSPDGVSYCVEVKAISKGGDDFVLTNNEMLVAKEKQDRYMLALVRDAGGVLEIAFIANPANTLAFERQCRQWAWVCSQYPFTPEKVALL